MKSPFIDDAKRNDRAIRDFEVVCKCEAKIVWLKLPSEWTDTEVQRQIDDAVRFYRKYCIELTFEEFRLDAAASDHAKRKEALDKLLAAYQRLAALIPKAKYTPEADLLAVQSVVEAIHDLVAGQVGTKTQVVFFLEEWYVRADRDKNRISANHGRRWLIGIDRYDRTSQLMLTHELAHGLRKDTGAGDKNKDCALKFARTNGIGNVAKRSWEDHYGGKNQDKAILHITRALAFRPYRRYTQQHVLTLREYMTIVAAGYVTCSPGCAEERRPRREKGR